MFDQLGNWIARRALPLIVAWVVLIGVSFWWAMSTPKAEPSGTDSFLPADSPQNRALELMRSAFPQLASRSEIVLVTHRPGGVTQSDLAWLDRVANQTCSRVGGHVLSPANPVFQPRLISRDREVAMALVGLQSNFISPKTVTAVESTERVIWELPPPDGLSVELTGTAGAGRDYSVHTAKALDRTTWVTVISVLLILVLVYRSPIGAVVPLLSIGASVFLAFVMLAMLAHLGWAISDMDRIFAVVLIFGAGVDYAMFWIARYRESLGEHGDFSASAISATRQAGPAILASAATTICGLTTLIVTDLIPTRNAGRILAAVLTIALFAALTLAPALARILGRWLFWPMSGTGHASVGQRLIWPHLANHVARRPGYALTAGLALLGCLSIAALRLDIRFDSLSELPPGSSSQRGFELATTHFSKGQLNSNNILVQFRQEPAEPDAYEAASRKLTDEIAATKGVYNVYSLSSPLGRTNAVGSLFVSTLLSSEAEPYFLSKTHDLLRIEVLISHTPFSPAAMDLMEHLRRTSQSLVEQLAPGAQVLMAGPTPYVIDVRDVAYRDQVVVMVLATVVIGAIVLVLIRDVPLTLFMLLATGLTYGATLTLSNLFFVHVMGTGELDWKVRLIVFVIVVAVGQDYNIFIVTRLIQETARRPRAEAVREAILRTGSVISSCGLIMAATLGSLWAGELTLLRQAGFTLALGILIDTFFVRPVLIPSFFLLTRRGSPVVQGTASSLELPPQPASPDP